jgi:hypothetical protein
VRVCLGCEGPRLAEPCSLRVVYPTIYLSIYLSICRRDLQDLAEAPRGRGAPWLELPWGEVRAALQLEHAVPGGLSEEEREGLFEEEAKRAREGRPRTRVDVSDLGLTMDDLTGPMGGT